MDDPGVTLNLFFPLVIFFVFLWILISSIPKISFERRTSERRSCDRRKDDRRTHNSEFCLFDRRITGNLLENRYNSIKYSDRRISDRRVS